jgi:hypothetical protein
MWYSSVTTATPAGSDVGVGGFRNAHYSGSTGHANIASASQAWKS